MARKPVLMAATLAAVVVLVGLLPQAGAHVTDSALHLWRNHIKPRLASPGKTNDPKNPVHWTKLKGVPEGFADGDDEVGARGPEGPVGPEGPRGPEGPPGDFSAVTKWSDTQVTVGSTEWTDLPGASISLTVPDNEQATVVAEFSSQGSSCNGGSCLLRILVDGTEAHPVLGDNSVWSGHMERAIGPLDPGNHTVKVQYGNKNGVSVTLNGWILTVHLAQAA